MNSTTRLSSHSRPFRQILTAKCHALAAPSLPRPHAARATTRRDMLGISCAAHSRSYLAENVPTAPEMAASRQDLGAHCPRKRLQRTCTQRSEATCGEKAHELGQGWVVVTFGKAGDIGSNQLMLACGFINPTVRCSRSNGQSAGNAVRGGPRSLWISSNEWAA